MSFLPGMYPGGALMGGGPPPASYVFNGIDEIIQRVLSTSGASQTIFTWSAWIKVVGYEGSGVQLGQVINFPTANNYLYMQIVNAGDGFHFQQDTGSSGTSWGEVAGPLSPDVPTNTWEHWVVRYDSTQGTAENRIRFYRNGAFVADTNSGGGQPGASEINLMFANGLTHEIGGFSDLGNYGDFKLAFLDVLEGVSVDASAFGFDDGGTWTRMPYAGSYGTYGFRLDGTDLFNDVSGNGQNFTPVNMDASNLDFADLPPFIL